MDKDGFIFRISAILTILLLSTVLFVSANSKISNSPPTTFDPDKDILVDEFGRDYFDDFSNPMVQDTPSEENVKNPKTLPLPEFPPIIYCRATEPGRGFITVPAGHFIQDGMTCFLTSLMNANLQEIYEDNPALFEYPAPENGISQNAQLNRQTIQDQMGTYFQECVNRVNNDNDPSNDIDVSNDVGVNINPAAQTPEQRAVMHCKNEAMNRIRNHYSGGIGLPNPQNPGEFTPLTVGQASERLVDLHGHDTRSGTIFPGHDTWIQRLREIISNGGNGIMGVDEFHTVTIISIDTTTNPPTMTIIDPNAGGETMTVPFNVGSDGAVTLPNGIPGWGPESMTVEYISGVEVTPNTNPSPTYSKPLNSGI